MKRVLLFVLLITAAAVCGVSRTSAEVIDRITAVVNGRIITLSDIRKEHEIALVLGDPEETDQAALKSLIDRALMEEEMAQFPGLDVSDKEIDERMKAIADFRGIAVSDIRNAVSRKIQRFKYFNLRFRQFVVVSTEEIQTEYEKVFVPEARRRGIDAPNLSQIQNEIREILIEKKVSDELDHSLEILHVRSNIEIL